MDKRGVVVHLRRPALLLDEDALHDAFDAALPRDGEVFYAGA